MKLALPLFAALALSGNAVAMTDHAHGSHPAAAPAAVEGVGVVRAINAKTSSVTIAHEPIPALKWPSMTMPFKVADPALLKDLKVGGKVRFQLQGQTIVGLKVL